jgi:hypothetical protein
VLNVFSGENNRSFIRRGSPSYRPVTTSAFGIPTESLQKLRNISPAIETSQEQHAEVEDDDEPPQTARTDFTSTTRDDFDPGYDYRDESPLLTPIVEGAKRGRWSRATLGQ